MGDLSFLIIVIINQTLTSGMVIAALARVMTRMALRFIRNIAAKKHAKQT